MNNFFELLAQHRLLPLVAPTTPEEAARAVISVGGGLLEIAQRHQRGLEALRDVADASEVLVGAGTVLSVSQATEVIEAGARFVVTPGFSPEIVAYCQDLEIPVLPGVSSAGEVMRALELGVDVVKLFPASLLGGPAMADALAGPFPDVRLVASGGISATMARAYLKRPNVIAVSRSLR